MNKKKSNRGGAREGAGRPTLDDAKQSLGLRVPTDIIEYLQTVANKSQAVTDALRRSKAYRDWKRSQS